MERFERLRSYCRLRVLKRLEVHAYKSNWFVLIWHVREPWKSFFWFFHDDSAWNKRIFVRIPWYEKEILWSYVASRGKKVFSRKSFKSFPKEVALKKLLVLCTTMYQDAWIEKTAKVVFKISQNAEVVQISRKVVTLKLFHDEDWFLHSLQSTLIVL